MNRGALLSALRDALEALTLRLAIAVAISLLPSSSRAYYAPLIFTPSAPVEGQQFSLRARFGVCDALVVAGPQDRELVVQGNHLRVMATGIYAPDLPFCIYPDGYADFEVGPLAAGTYDVQLYRRDLFVPSDVQLVQSGSVTVGLASATQVPSLRTVSLAILVGLVLAIALRSVRLRRG